ncbi:MAG: acylphosphatase [Nitrospirota bacterium]
MKKRLHLIIKGRVQGVFYRASTRDAAVKLRLKGWVRNMPDGSVEALFEGDEEALGEVLRWCRNGPPGAYVSKIEERWDEFTGEFDRFDIRYGY